MAITKADVLDGLAEIHLCNAYEYKGEKLTEFPIETQVLEQVKPLFQSVKGWEKPVTGVRDFQRLPGGFKDYIKLIEDLTETEINIISTGPDRADTIRLDSLEE